MVTTRRLRSDPAKVAAWKQRSRRRLPARSTKSAREASAHIAIRSAVFERDGWTCQARGWRGSCFGVLTVHHLLKASQGGVYEPSNLLSTCQMHNDMIEDYPAEAHAMGFVVRRGDLPLRAESPGRLRPVRDGGPVPAGATADGPLGIGQKAPLAPHVHGVALDAESLCDVVGPDRIACAHNDSMRCPVTLDKSSQTVQTGTGKAKRPAPVANRGTPTSRREGHYQ